MNDRNWVLGVLALGHGIGHWITGATSVCLPLILKDLGMTYTQVGFIRSIQQIVIMTSTLAGGLATDLLDRRKAILILSTLWPFLFFFFQGYADSFLVFAVLVWAGMLFGGFLWHPSARSVIGEIFPDRMGFALGIHGMGANLAQAAAPIAVGAVLWFINWRAAFKLHLIPGLLAAFAIWQLLPSLSKTFEDKKETTSYLAGFRGDVLGNLPFLGITLVAALRSVGEHVLPTFLPLYLAHELKMNTATVGAYLSSLALVGTVASPVIGSLSDRSGRKPVIFFCLLTGGILITAIPHIDSAALLFAIVSLGGVVVFSVGSVIQASGLEHAPRQLWGSAQSFMDVARSALAFVFPLVAGWMADRYGLGATFYLFGAANLLAALVIFSVPYRTR